MGCYVINIFSDVCLISSTLHPFPEPFLIRPLQFEVFKHIYSLHSWSNKLPVTSVNGSTKIVTKFPLKPQPQTHNIMDPSGPSQPSWPNAYETKGNPADSSPAEQRRAEQKQHQHGTSPAVEERKPGAKQHSSTANALPTSLAQGVSGGAIQGEERYGRSEEDVGRHRELDGEQMRAPGEGRVAQAVEDKPGAGPPEQDFASDLDR